MIDWNKPNWGQGENVHEAENGSWVGDKHED